MLFSQLCSSPRGKHHGIAEKHQLALWFVTVCVCGPAVLHLLDHITTVPVPHCVHGGGHHLLDHTVCIGGAAYITICLEPGVGPGLPGPLCGVVKGLTGIPPQKDTILWRGCAHHGCCKLVSVKASSHSYPLVLTISRHSGRCAHPHRALLSTILSTFMSRRTCGSSFDWWRIRACLSPESRITVYCTGVGTYAVQPAVSVETDKRVG